MRAGDMYEGDCWVYESDAREEFVKGVQVRRKNH